MNPTPNTPRHFADLDAQMGRRKALKLGGLTVSLAALAAACGDDRTGDTAPGRVGNAPTIEALPEYDVNDAVLLRTASSLENTAIYVYEVAQGLGAFEGDMAVLVDRIVADHRATAAEMDELTEAAGGVAWTTTNPWIMERAVNPILATILEPQTIFENGVAVLDADNEPVTEARSAADITLDVVDFAITLENLASSTHQALASALSQSEQRLAVASASVEEARHAAALVLEQFGTARRVSPALVGAEVVNVNGIIPRYAIETTFGSLEPEEILLGPVDENGARAGFILATPAENSFIYEELEITTE